jgi:Tfp pilus assembly protein PilV
MLRSANHVSNERGYLLFEVIVAVAVLSVGLVMLLRCFAAPLRAVDVSEDHLTAALLLEEKMEELQTGYEWDSGATEGVFSGQSDKFRWRIETTSYTPMPGQSTDLAEVEVTVFWREENRERSIHLTSLIFQK